MKLVYPELLLLAIPVALFYFVLVYRREKGSGAFVLAHIARGLVLALLLLAAAGPTLTRGGVGAQVVVVVDRSLSMPDGSDARSIEIISHLHDRASESDSIGVVTFGERAAVEKMPSAGGRLAEFTRDVGQDESNLDRGLNTALQLFPPGRKGRILVISDGEYTGESPRDASLEAAHRGIEVDYRHISRSQFGDVAVDEIALPRSVRAGQPFQFPVWVHSDGRKEASYHLSRGDVSISRGRRMLNPGMNRLDFRDVLESQGIRRYTFVVQADGDPIPENNIARGSLRVEGKPTVLVINTSGAEGNLARSLVAAGIECDVRSPGEAPSSVAGFMDYRAVILENVSANALGGSRLYALNRAVTEGGSGLLVTGGRSSFGMGGYFRSELDPALPVSMELREEHRRMTLALGVVLDRSGSMRMPVSRDMTKMDLANLGTVAAIEMLGDHDSAFVLAVDTKPHVIVPLSPMSMRQEIMEKARNIESIGGGIYVYTGLKEAGKHLREAEQSTRHIILFSDAADSEEPGDYKNLLAEFQREGITVSVIGIGNERDVDADFLIDVAERGGGRIVFTQTFEELPKLFAEETMAVARASFVQEATSALRTSGIYEFGAGADEIGMFPPVEGYNLTYLRPEASQAFITDDDMKAPLVAFWHRRLGRAAAITAEVDGEFSGGLLEWENYSRFFSSLTRWLMGDDEPADARATLELKGFIAEISVEFDPDQPPAGQPTAYLLPPGRGEAIQVPLSWDSRFALSGRARINETGPHVGVVRLAGDRRLITPPTEMPYSSEFAPAALTGRGRDTLETIAVTTGGREKLRPEGVFSPRRGWNGERDIARMFIIVALCVFLLEIAAGRFGLWPYIRLPKISTSLFQKIKKIFQRIPMEKEAEGAGRKTSYKPIGSTEKHSAKPGVEPEKSGAENLDVLEKAKRRAGRRFR